MKGNSKCKFQKAAQAATTALDHQCLLDIDAKCATARNTSIVCTIGPVTKSVEKLRELILAGMDIARLNFSHGDHDYHRHGIKIKYIDIKISSQDFLKDFSLKLLKRNVPTHERNWYFERLFEIKHEIRACFFFCTQVK